MKRCDIMIVGKNNLIKLFPDFKEDIAENGIDLRVGKIYKLSNVFVRGSVDDKKMLPDMEELKITNDIPREIYDIYILNNKDYYIVEIDRPIHIPDGYCQIYKIRSTFARCGLQLISAVGDNDFNGTLRLGLKNLTNSDIYIGKNERIIQALTIKNDGTASSYDGDYQNDKIYED